MSDTSDFPTAENKSQIENAITRFERQFARDHSTRIESFLKDHNSDNENQSLKDNPELVAELIYVEMDLRHEQGQEFTQLEYLRRFPQFKDVISDAWQRLPNVTEKFAARDDDLIVSIHKTSTETGTIAELIVDKQGISEVPDQIGKYKNLSFIAKGGFGLVYRALDEDSKQHVALKFPRMRRQNGRIVDSSAMQLIFEEASKSSHLEHPGIVRTIATETIDKFVFVVQEFVDGQDLRATLSKNRSHIEIAQLIAKIAEALGYANHERIVHRDLKPANILLTKNDEPKIADFGLAFHDSIQVDLPDGRCGTPHYMSPELVQGLNKQLDGRTDIWSLGVIFYELLAGERPFIGKNETEIFKQIETRDPKPLRQIDPSIDLELEWICLKCLEKRPSDRFGVAKDLADHLWKWIDNQLEPDETTDTEQSDTPTHTRKETAILPRGLRSYGREDAEAFMQLLPGLRDHKGVPSSIRFWQVRIREPVADENRVPVGVIYGPSGSGKSSFVKAGLLPNLGNAITSVYIESTREDTEVRIIKALRRRYPNIPYDKSLPQIFSGLVDGDWGTAGQKILIVIDQFEQRLSINDDYDQSQLAKAIKHCDGQRVQCLLLVRDDFWIGLTRFTEAIEMNLLVGQNSQDIDLFDKKHARNVLVKLGQAYDRLPNGKQFGSLSKNEKAFVKEAVEQLSDGNQVICVRLALIAEMFKDRDWTREELKKVGGVQGVGETFLESTFGSESKSKKYQLQKNAAQAVLSELLPDTGTDIRGSMKSEADLRQAAGLENRPERFDELIDTLDNELKLITRTSPDEAESATTNDVASATNEKLSHFQLTHDFLVQTIRNWLTAVQRATYLGRKRLQISDMAQQYNQTKQKQLILGWFDYAVCAIGLRDVMRNNRHSMYWKAAKTRFLFTTTVFVTVAASVIAIILISFNIHFQARAKDLLLATLNCDPELFQHALNDLESFKDRMPRLTNDLKLESKSQLLHLHMLKCRLEINSPDNIEQIIRLIPDCDQGECDNVIVTLKRLGHADKDFAFELLLDCANRETHFDRKMRFVTVLLFAGNPTEVTKILESPENIDFQTFWIHEFGSWRPKLTQHKQSIESLQNSNLIGYLILSLGLQPASDYSPAELEFINPWMQTHFVDSPSGFVHSCSKYSLNALFGQIPVLTNTSNKRKQWYVDSFGQTFIQANKSELRYIPKSFVGDPAFFNADLFILDSEVTRDVYEEFLKATNATDTLHPIYCPDAKSPANPVSMENAILFCNWLNSVETPNLENCYSLINGKWHYDGSKSGYRIPTYSEYLAITQIEDGELYYFGSSRSLKYLRNYILCEVSLDNPEKEIPSPPYGRLPNHVGLFDLRGNVEEWTWNSNYSYLNPKMLQRLFGGNFANPLESAKPRIQAKVQRNFPDHVFRGIGFRVARRAF